MGKLVLVDGNAIVHRAYHALPASLSTRSGEPINAVYGFVAMLLRVIQDLDPQYIAVAFDRKEPTFRHQEYEKYQAHRPEMDEGLSSQFEKARRTIGAFGIPIFSEAGYEADDVIGTLASLAEKEKKVDQVIIVTGDKDILQLVKGKTRVYLPIRGLSDAQLMGSDEVVEKLGIKPEQVADYKALVGDPSDNYPGVKGIGPKTAITLLEEHGTLEGIYKNIKKIPEKIREKLVDQEEQARLFQRLARIVIDLPINLSPEELDDWQVDSQEVLDLFQEFGFRTLTKRVKKVGEERNQKQQIPLL